MKCGWLFRWQSAWLGVHYSPYNQRWCINVLPFVTFWVCKEGGLAPDEKAEKAVETIVPVEHELNLFSVDRVDEHGQSHMDVMEAANNAEAKSICKALGWDFYGELLGTVQGGTGKVLWQKDKANRAVKSALLNIQREQINGR